MTSSLPPILRAWPTPAEEADAAHWLARAEAWIIVAKATSPRWRSSPLDRAADAIAEHRRLRGLPVMSK